MVQSQVFLLFVVDVFFLFWVFVEGLGSGLQSVCSTLPSVFQFSLSRDQVRNTNNICCTTSSKRHYPHSSIGTATYKQPTSRPENKRTPMRTSTRAPLGMCSGVLQRTLSQDLLFAWELPKNVYSNPLCYLHKEDYFSFFLGGWGGGGGGSSAIGRGCSKPATLAAGRGSRRRQRGERTCTNWDAPPYTTSSFIRIIGGGGGALYYQLLNKDYSRGGGGGVLESLLRTASLRGDTPVCELHSL